MTSALKSRMFSVIVGKETVQTFHIHADLLALGSDCLAKDVAGGFLEQSIEVIRFEEEDPALFSHFVQFLYIHPFFEGPSSGTDDDFLKLARLYALGGRLQALEFQKLVFKDFSAKLPHTMSIYRLCEVLDIVCSELPEKDAGGPLSHTCLLVRSQEAHPASKKPELSTASGQTPRPGKDLVPSSGRQLGPIPQCNGC